MNFRAIHTYDAAHRAIVFEEYIGAAPYERFKRLMLPRTNDVDVVISTKKHGDVSLGKLLIADSKYLEWLVGKSRQTKTIKYAAVRLLNGTPYAVPEHDHRYDISMFFDFNDFIRMAKGLNIEIHDKQN